MHQLTGGRSVPSQRKAGGRIGANQKADGVNPSIFAPVAKLAGKGAKPNALLALPPSPSSSSSSSSSSFSLPFSLLLHIEGSARLDRTESHRGTATAATVGHVTASRITKQADCSFMPTVPVPMLADTLGPSQKGREVISWAGGSVEYEGEDMTYLINRYPHGEGTLRWKEEHWGYASQLRHHWQAVPAPAHSVSVPCTLVWRVRARCGSCVQPSRRE